MRARYYDPVTGEFISRDPAAPSTREPYAYVGDSPQNSSDPSGLYDCGWAVWNCIHPENLINGIVKLQEKIMSERAMTRRGEPAPAREPIVVGA